MEQQLTVSQRPKSFDDMIGQEEMCQSIRQLFKKRMVKAMLFSGGTGSGKTTVARIIGLSAQCKHSEFGSPCDVCREKKSSFDIIEINASDATQVDTLRQTVSGAFYSPKPGSRRRVYILDEAQMLSKHSQNLLLKYFEDAPATTLWIVCTTAPEAIIETLRGRCVKYKMRGLTYEGVGKLIRRTLKRAKSSLEAGPLIDAANEIGMDSPRNVVMACEKYISGESPEVSVSDAAAAIDTYALNRMIVRGDWDKARLELQKVASTDAVGMRIGIVKYLQAILLESTEIQDSTKAIAQAIYKLSTLTHAEYSLQLAATSAVVYELCALFARYKR